MKTPNWIIRFLGWISRNKASESERLRDGVLLEMRRQWGVSVDPSLLDGVQSVRIGRGKVMWLDPLCKKAADGIASRAETGVAFEFKEEDQSYRDFFVKKLTAAQRKDNRKRHSNSIAGSSSLSNYDA